MGLCCSCCQWQSRSCSVSTCHTWTILSKSLILSRMNRAKPDQAPSLKLTGESWFDLWKILQAEKMNSTSASSINSDYQLTSHCLEPLRWNVNDDDIRRSAASLRGIRQSRVLSPDICFHVFPSSCTSKRLFLLLLFLLFLAAANKCSVKFSGNVVLQKNRTCHFRPKNRGITSPRPRSRSWLLHFHKPVRIYAAAFLVFDIMVLYCIKLCNDCLLCHYYPSIGAANKYQTGFKTFCRHYFWPIGVVLCFKSQ